MGTESDASRRVACEGARGCGIALLYGLIIPGLSPFCDHGSSACRHRRDRAVCPSP
ncbi:hypothetical protein [Cyanobium sp. WKJ7-Wakatipu]|uniref:hypothetical protein n=1 Tax=Cyanobium sp. WKJ7-Wakatipu TaxID=2823726 RepID=UPI0020CCC85A|nr:hypothetical protein [Cyanobium sp. WKJ7-Wakatipu]